MARQPPVAAPEWRAEVTFLCQAGIPRTLRLSGLSLSCHPPPPFPPLWWLKREGLVWQKRAGGGDWLGVEVEERGVFHGDVHPSFAPFVYLLFPTLSLPPPSLPAHSSPSLPALASASFLARAVLTTDLSLSLVLTFFLSPVT